jgi:methylenetetrahydrofolate reductase (NADPH)
VVDGYVDLGVRHIVALRGDPLAGLGTPYIPHAEGYHRAADLVAGIKRRHPSVEVSVSAYVERHPESRDWIAEIDNLRRKVDAGADRIITQFFFDNDLFARFRERTAAAGISIPIVPGIVPVLNFSQTAKFAAKVGATVPAWLAARFEGLEEDAATRQLVAAAVCAEQVLDLVDRGVTSFHFYTMNRADLVYAICYLLGLRPAKAAASVAAA